MENPIAKRVREEEMYTQLNRDFYSSSSSDWYSKEKKKGLELIWDEINFNAKGWFILSVSLFFSSRISVVTIVVVVTFAYETVCNCDFSWNHSEGIDNDDNSTLVFSTNVNYWMGFKLLYEFFGVCRCLFCMINDDLQFFKNLVMAIIND